MSKSSIPTRAQIIAMLDKMTEYFGAGMMTSILYNQLPPIEKKSLKQEIETLFRKYSFTHPEANPHSYLAKNAKEILETPVIKEWLITHYILVYRAVEKTMALSAVPPYRSAEEYQSYCKTLDLTKQQFPKSAYAEIEKASGIQDQMKEWANQGLRGKTALRADRIKPFPFQHPPAAKKPRPIQSHARIPLHSDISHATP